MTPRAISSAITILLLSLVLAAVVLGILRMDAVTVQTVLGAVCAYFCLGLIFSAIYVFLDAVGRAVLRSVRAQLGVLVLQLRRAHHHRLRRLHRPHRLRPGVVVVEAIVGQIFLATAIARIVSLYRSPRAPAEGE